MKRSSMIFLSMFAVCFFVATGCQTVPNHEHHGNGEVIRPEKSKALPVGWKEGWSELTYEQFMGDHKIRQKVIGIFSVGTAPAREREKMDRAWKIIQAHKKANPKKHRMKDSMRRKGDQDIESPLQQRATIPESYDSGIA